MASMKAVWPQSKWAHAGIALLVAAISSVIVFHRIEATHFAEYAREYPHDGQDGFGAFGDAIQAATLTIVIAFAVVFGLQRLLLKALTSHS